MVDGGYRSRIDLVELGDVPADVVAQQDGGQHLSDGAAAARRDPQVLHAAQVQQALGDALAERDTGVLVSGFQEKDHDVVQEARRALVAVDGVMVELRKLLVGRPGFAVLVELRLPTVRYFGHDTAAVDHYRSALNRLRD